MFRNLPRHELRSDSEIPWMPPLPTHWSIERGKSLFHRVQREPNETDGVVTCFRDGVVTLRSRRRTTGFTESLKEIGYQGIRRGDLVIHAMDAFAGAVGVSDSDGKGTPVYSVCVPRGNANPYYFAAVVREMARTSWIHSLAKGVRERSTDFRFDAFAVQQLPVPPVEEQAAIVKYLAHANARIDNAIAAKRRLISLLEEHSLVKLDDLIQSCEGEIVSIGQTSSLVQTGPFGSQLHADEYVEDGIPVINPSHLVAGRIEPDSQVTVSAKKGEELRRHRLQLGDLVVARRGDLGRCAVVSGNAEGWLCGTGSLIVRLRTQDWNPDYFQLLFSSERTKEKIELGSIGSTMSNLNASLVSRLRLKRPSLERQAAVVEQVVQVRRELDYRRDLVRREIALLSEFRTRLISDVVTGQVDVRAIAKTLPDAPADSKNCDVDTPAVDVGLDVDVSTEVA